MTFHEARVPIRVRTRHCLLHTTMMSRIAYSCSRRTFFSSQLATHPASLHERYPGNLSSMFIKARTTQPMQKHLARHRGRTTIRCAANGPDVNKRKRDFHRASTRSAFAHSSARWEHDVGRRNDKRSFNSRIRVMLGYNTTNVCYDTALMELC